MLESFFNVTQVVKITIMKGIFGALQDWHWVVLLLFI